MKNILILSIFLIIQISSITPVLTPSHTIDNNVITVIAYLNHNDQKSALIQQSINYVYLNFQSRADVDFFIVNCQQNKKLPTCDKYKADQYLKLFSYGTEILYRGQINPKNVLSWVNRRLQSYAERIDSREQLINKIQQHSFIFCYFPIRIQNNPDFNLYKTLARKFPYIRFYYIQDKSLRQSLKMKLQNITMYKNSNLERKDLEIKNPEIWEAFVLSYAFPNINIIDSNQLTKKRFDDSQNYSFVALFCDQSIECDEAIPTYYQYSLKNVQTPIKLLMFSTDKLREVVLIKLYFHIKFEKAPSLVYIKQNDGYLNISIQNCKITQESIKQFVNNAVEQKLPLFQLSENQFENNGYTGKNMQKYIQKLNYNSFNRNVIQSPEHYLVLFTITGSGCIQCQNYYKEFRKLRSYLQDEKGIVFAKYEFLNNLLNIKEVDKVPEVILFKAGEKDKPIRFFNRFGFDETFSFLKKHIQFTNTQL